MNEFTINSSAMGRRVTFWSNGNEAYVHVDLNGKAGCLGQQICEGGMLLGSTIRSSEGSFEMDCRRWWKAFLRNTEGLR
jgi:hypothetical protein